MTCQIAGALALCRPHRGQPLTHFMDVVEFGGYGHGPLETHLLIRGYAPRRQFRCHKCRARRWAKNLRIITGGGWYDPMILCADKHRWRR